MSLNIAQKIWVYAERLYLHAYRTEEFLEFLTSFGIEYNNDVYKTLGKTSSPMPLYKFMSEENYTFAKFMQMVPSYKYLTILEAIIFDPKIIETKRDNWNYYGEPIKKWYPTVLELLKLADVKIDEKERTLHYDEEDYVPSPEDFLPHSFNDAFLDYLRKEANENYRQERFLSVMFLSRKILEVLCIRISEVVFPKIENAQYNSTNHALWFDIKRNSYHNFGVLLDNFKSKSLSFHEDKDLILHFCSLVKPFKDETNSCVHDDYKIPDATYVKSWKIDHIVNLARRIYKKYCNP